MIKHMIIQVSHKSIKYLKRADKRSSTTKEKHKREQKQHSLSKPMIYTFSPPLATSYQKVHKKCIVLNRLSGLVLMWWCRNDYKDEGIR